MKYETEICYLCSSSFFKFGGVENIRKTGRSEEEISFPCSRNIFIIIIKTPRVCVCVGGSIFICIYPKPIKHSRSQTSIHGTSSKTKLRKEKKFRSRARNFLY